MIISLHMPKCGGTSFMELLQSHFGLRFAKDYDYPIHKSFAERTEKAVQAKEWIEFKHKYLFGYRFKECIHGHFLPYKYDYFYKKRNSIFVTWMRDPIDRIVSHYNFWIRSYEHNRNPRRLHRKVVEEEWTLQDFAFCEELQNFYSIFLWNFPIEQFEFIGITEHYEDDLRYFGQKYLNVNNIDIPQKNVSPGRDDSFFSDEGLIEELKSFHHQDYQLYNYALKEREKRSTKYA